MDVSYTIIPKSDQLNADDLLSGPITVKVRAVKPGTPDQPVMVFFEGDNERPYKPCKSMRRLLVYAWGVDAREWVGRTMTLYNDPEVMWGGVKVGGIRISHLSHIDRDLELALTVSKGKRAPYRVRRLDDGRAGGGPLPSGESQLVDATPPTASGAGAHGTVAPVPPAILALPELARDKCVDWWERIARASRAEAANMTDEKGWQALLARLDQLGYGDAKAALAEHMKKAMGF